MHKSRYTSASCAVVDAELNGKSGVKWLGWFKFMRPWPGGALHLQYIYVIYMVCSWTCVS